MSSYLLAPNHGRYWDYNQTFKLVHAAAAYDGEYGYAYPTIEKIAERMGRSKNSILSRMYAMLGNKNLVYGDEVLYKFRNHCWSDYMKDQVEPISSKGPSKYRLVSSGFSSIPADTMEEAETTARALLQKNPTREIFIFQAVKRVFTPANVTIEDLE